MNTVEYREAQGRALAGERRRHGLSQPLLAAVAGRPPSQLTGLTRDGAGELRRSATAESLRLVLAGAHSLCAMLGESYAPALGTLRTATERACELASAGEFDQLSAALGKLLPRLEAAVRTMPPPLQADAYELTAMAYQACSAALVKLAEPLAAWVAADRAMAAAERAGKLLLAAAGQYRFASVLLDSREYALADEMARTTLLALRGLAELSDPDALSLCGGLTVLRAVIAARTSNRADAFSHLAKARLLASRLGTREASAMPEFGALYVALFEIAVCLDLDDSAAARRAAASLDSASLSRALDLEFGQSRDRDRARQVICELLNVQTPPSLALATLAERLGAVRP